MTNDEPKKKIAEIIQKARNDYSEFFRQELKEAFRKGEKHFGNRDCSMTFYDYVADALIAAGIGDVEYERFVFKKAYMDFFTRFNRDKEFHKNFDSVTLGCQIGKFEDMMEKTKKELAEGRKDD